jgi:predicted DsbA family dithiol-disulfide isomerase
MNLTENKMKIEVWSDIMCPFCYIGKRKLDMALAIFKEAQNIEVTWKSFQLMPDMITVPGKNINQLLSEEKSISLEHAKSMNDYVSEMASQIGLKYNFNIAVPANTFNAHRLSHLAKQYGLQNEIEEKLFAAYFTEGKNVDDINTLIEIGRETGLNAGESEIVLNGNKFEEEVRYDIYEAKQSGIRGVPFFLFNNKQTISGAQDNAVFMLTLTKAYTEWMDALQP